jgi:hypothetical protein
MNSIRVTLCKKINIGDRGTFGIQVDEESNSRSKLADSSSTDL